MPKPKKERSVQQPPTVTYFKPHGVPMARLEQVLLNVDEYEAIRLVDYENMDQAAAADKLGISRPTCARIVSGAHKKIAEAITLGKAIRIEGGNFKLVQNRLLCRDCGASWRVPRMAVENAGHDADDITCPECESSNPIDLGKAVHRMSTPGTRRRHHGRHGRG